MAVGIVMPQQKSDLDELAALVDTAGGLVAGRTEQTLTRPNPRSYIGKGKVEEVELLIRELEATLVIFDVELTPAQQRNLQASLGVRVIDRNQLILDIFALHAWTREGRIQVELAQLQYLLPRLVGKGLELSRLGGGIGTRGPGETKLEVDRRRIRRRITELQKELEQVKKHRKLLQEQRRLPLIALVGYTNAGKSTLLNSLTGAKVTTADRLFATLDPTIRRCRLPDGRWVLLTDTVGFIKNIPHDLIAAFRATLEGVEQADVILHVVDASHPRYDEQMETVLSVLGELDVLEKPIFTVLNKKDLHPNPGVLTNLAQRYQPAIVISAFCGENLAALLAGIGQLINEELVEKEFMIEYGNGGVLERLHSQALVLQEEYREEGIKVKARLTKRLLASIDGDIKLVSGKKSRPTL